MLNSTIDLVKAPEGSNYTAARLNTIFQTIATVLNGKVDSRDPSVVELSVNGNRVINMAPGIEPGDAITFAQLKAMAAGDEVDRKSAKYVATYQPWVPLEVTQSNFAEAVRENILGILAEIPFKLYDGPNPLRKEMDASGVRIGLVADPIHPNDAVNLRTLVEFARAL